MPDVDEDADTETSSADGDRALREVRPGVDPARLRRSLASAERALFGAAEPARLGRFVLLGPIAGGGMGMVHGAYDPRLDRRVALKLLHPGQHGDARGRERLLVEARALAKVAHPNVVSVHEVLAIDEQVVIVMELVAGQTVAEWEREATRSWREVVAIYLQAGRGLAAAHTLGIVHRDFKPSNAIVGADGRVRVLDFGLARLSGPEDVEVDATTLPDGPAPSSARSRVALTDTGAFLGTEAFAAPEQLEAGTTTAASDQFSFCVALYRALHDVAPFVGDTPASRLVSIRAARIAPPAADRRSPAWLRAAVTRGLAADPADRHRSMADLLDLLGREHGWRRWRTTLVAGVAAAALVAAVVAVATRGDAAAALPSCDAGARLAEVWQPARRLQLETALARPGTPYAREVVQIVLDGLDRYAAAWSELRGDTCVAYRDLAESAELFDKKVSCLDRRLADLASAVDVLTRSDLGTTIDAAGVVARLPPLSDCSDREALLAETPPPATLAARRSNDQLNARLSQAATLDRGGASTEALRLATAALADARALGYAPTIVRAALLQGRILLSRQEYAGAVAPLTAAADLALDGGQLTAAVEAEARRLYVVAMVGQDLPALAGEAAVLERLGRGLRTRRGAQFVRPLLLNNIGVLHMARGDRAQAQRYFQEAWSSLAGIPDPDLELTMVIQNLALVTADPDRRVELARTAYERFRDKLASQHVSTLEALYNLGSYTTDPGQSLSLVARACDGFRDHHRELVEVRSRCVFLRAFLLSVLEKPAEAAAAYAEVVEISAASTDDEVVTRRLLAQGYERLHRDEPRAARDQFAAVATRFAGPIAWWQRKPQAIAALGAGLAALDLGLDRQANEQLELAATTFEELLRLNEGDVELQQRLALARRMLTAAGRPGPRSRSGGHTR